MVVPLIEYEATSCTAILNRSNEAKADRAVPDPDPLRAHPDKSL
jgi:hypothetical protein